jgi:hypothetical protein
MPAPRTGPDFPRLANMYLHGAVDPADIPSLARWDLVILDSNWTREDLRRLRDQNPDIKILFYICPYCMTVSPPPTDAWRRDNLNYVQTQDLWWRNADRTIASDWDGVQLVNITDVAPAGPWGTFRRWFAVRIQDLVASQPDLDGVFYDNFWKSISWQQGSVIRVDSDCNPTRNPGGCNGYMDAPATVDTLWNRALRSFAGDTRRRLNQLDWRPRPVVTMGNGASDYFQWLNGSLYEGFPSGNTPADPGNAYGYNWYHEMFAEPSGYLVARFRKDPYSTQVINAGARGGWDAPERTPDFERHKRFTLCSTLLGDGYYSLDRAQAGHGSLWWEPEYDGGGLGKGYLGQALGPMRRLGEPGGSEKVVNGGFETGVLPWQTYPNNADASMQLDMANPHTGRIAARIDFRSSAPGGGFKMYQTVSLMGGMSYILKFWARSDASQDLTVHLYSQDCPSQRCLEDLNFQIGPDWKLYEVPFVASGNALAGLNFFVQKPGSLWLDDVSMQMGNSAIYRRDFERGIVLVNYNPSPARIGLGAPFVRLRVPGSPVWDGAVVTTEVVPPSDGRILLRNSNPTDAGPEEPRRGVLWRSEPNPFRPSTEIHFAVEQAGVVRLEIFDVAGRRVRTLLDRQVEAGVEQRVRWDATDGEGRKIPAGVYFARLITPDAERTQKLTLLP